MKKHWGVLVVIIIIASVVFAIGGAPLIRFLADQERVRAWIEGFGVWGPLALIAMIIVQTVLSISPVRLARRRRRVRVWVLARRVVCVHRTGDRLGLVHDSGAALRAAAGRPIDRSQVGRRLRPVYGEARAEFFFVIFVMPWVPDDLACYAIGLSRLSLKLMIVLAAFGRMPSVIVQCWLAAYAAELPAGVIIGVVAGGVLLGVAFYRYHRQLEQLVVNLAAQFQRRAAVPVAEPMDDGED